VAQGVIDPEFKPQYPRKTKRNKKTIKRIFVWNSLLPELALSVVHSFSGTSSRASSVPGQGSHRKQEGG
jgi:hypothetical protein